MGNVRSKDFANDIIVIRQRDNTRRCSRVNVRFRHEKDITDRNRKVVTVSINGITLDPRFSLNELNGGGSRLASSCLEIVLLRHGLNYITFRIKLRGQDVQVKASIFFWSWDSRIVITDVDGTITKSDKRGILMCSLGRKWIRNGVCRLFSAIHKNGYKVIYLTGRPRYDVEETRKWIQNMEQDDKGLPDGAVLVSPKGWRAAVYREVFMRFIPWLAKIKDEDFKTPMLKQIRELFPEEAVPFCAGFGNRSSDERTYRELKIPSDHIFHLSPKNFMGRRRIQVKHDHKNSVAAEFSDDFEGLYEFVNTFFPPVRGYAAVA